MNIPNRSCCFIAFFWMAFFIGFHAAEAQQLAPGWQWLNPKPHGLHLSKVQFLDSLTGFAIGEHGLIQKTTDGGDTWKIQYSDSQLEFNALFFLNHQLGWVGSRKHIYHTQNGGQTWVKQEVAASNGIYALQFLDGQNGWAAGWRGKLFKTTNGGLVWDSVGRPGILNITSMHFLNPQTGWMVGFEGKVFKTTNGGATWNTYPCVTTPLAKVVARSSSLVWVCGQDGVLRKSTDGGLTWEVVSIPTTTYLLDLEFEDDNKMYAVGFVGRCFQSTNAGQTWTARHTGSPFDLRSISIAGPGKVWVAGGGGTIYRMGTPPNTWTKLAGGSVNTQLYDVDFFTPELGLAVGTGNALLRTSNGGATWSVQTGGVNEDLHDVYFVSSGVAWACGDQSVLKSTDGGITWTNYNQNRPSTSSVRSSVFRSENLGWVGTWGGRIQKTTDGGVTWTSQTLSSSEITEIFFLNDSTGFAGNSSGEFYKTTDGGNNWNMANDLSTERIYSIHFLNPDWGWVLAANRLFHTTNGGQTWSSAPLVPMSFGKAQVHFIDSLQGWLSLRLGTVYRTHDGGQTWKTVVTGCMQPINRMCVKDSSHIWLAGSFGAILRKTPAPDTVRRVRKISGLTYEKIGSCADKSQIFPGVIVKASPGPFYALSDQQGRYDLVLPSASPSDTFTLRALEKTSNAFRFRTACPPDSQYVVTYSPGSDSVSGKDFGMDVPPCHHLRVEIASNRRRRCFRNVTTLSFVNEGRLTAPNAYILLEFPSYVRGISADRPYEILNDSTWKFALDSVQSGESGSIHVLDSVVCGIPEIRNLSQCTYASIYPIPDCPSLNWNGSAVSIETECSLGISIFTIKNATTIAMTDSVAYQLFLDSALVASGKVMLAAGSSKQVWLETNGLPAFLQVNQVALHPTETMVSATIEACDDSLVLFPRPLANRFADAASAHQKSHCLPIIDSFDPNDKQAFPIGFTANRVVPPDTRLTFLLRFQNTGTDTAYTVYLIDTLDPNLDVESLEMGAVSHPYQARLQTAANGRNYLRFQFDRIMLVDSITNEPLSHGFVQFRMQPKAGLPLGSQVRNRADIYFDFNPPVLTNTTLNTFDRLVFTDSTLEDQVFGQPPVRPVLNTLSVLNIGLTSAQSGGNIVSDGGPNVRARGVVWATSPSPSLEQSFKTEDGIGTGSFSSQLTNLQPGTTYFLRAYARNTVGTGYGNERTFTTLVLGRTARVEDAGFSVQPNPFHQQLSIRMESGKPQTLIIRTALGTEVFRSEIQGSADITLPDLPPGVYWLEAEGRPRRIPLLKQE